MTRETTPENTVKKSHNLQRRPVYCANNACTHWRVGDLGEAGICAFPNPEHDEYGICDSMEIGNPIIAYGR